MGAMKEAVTPPYDEKAIAAQVVVDIGRECSWDDVYVLLQEYGVIPSYYLMCRVWAHVKNLDQR
jgi:hypothetical protein